MPRDFVTDFFDQIVSVGKNEISFLGICFVFENDCVFPVQI